MSFLIENILKKPTTNDDKTTGIKELSYKMSSSEKCDWSEESSRYRVKKRRNLFSKHQTWQLEKKFLIRPYMSAEERETLASKIHLTPTQIKIWFQNHRYKLKKDLKDISKSQRNKQTYQPCYLSLPQYTKYILEGKFLYEQCKIDSDLNKSLRGHVSEYQTKHMFEIKERNCPNNQVLHDCYKQFPFKVEANDFFRMMKCSEKMHTFRGYTDAPFTL
ncbi:muscle-specific homeobox protein tinman [Hydra vulgaris]|uniref:Muscle-specific homeobox protein tinman n=1 Tax=Hydra vulgaris TaxID=6087 RepID=A0ABM4BYX6_HYDVU